MHEGSGQHPRDNFHVAVRVGVESSSAATTSSLIPTEAQSGCSSGRSADRTRSSGASPARTLPLRTDPLARWIIAEVPPAIGHPLMIPTGSTSFSLVGKTRSAMYAAMAQITPATKHVTLSASVNAIFDASSIGSTTAAGSRSHRLHRGTQRLFHRRRRRRRANPVGSRSRGDTRRQESIPKLRCQGRPQFVGGLRDRPAAQLVLAAPRQESHRRSLSVNTETEAHTNHRQDDQQVAFEVNHPKAEKADRTERNTANPAARRPRLRITRAATRAPTKAATSGGQHWKPGCSGDSPWTSWNCCARKK